MKHNKQKAFFLVLALLFTVPALFAVQELPPPSPQGPPGLLVDGGIVALLVAGLFYGVKKSFKKR
ncbi:MAG: hypothetical protein COA88_07855 [Kordia sp.]|nr:MAG: hypothetical protein COA88_07855 [Kordia sp.]